MTHKDEHVPNTRMTHTNQKQAPCARMPRKHRMTRRANKKTAFPVRKDDTQGGARPQHKDDTHKRKACPLRKDATQGWPARMMFINGAARSTFARRAAHAARRAAPRTPVAWRACGRATRCSTTICPAGPRLTTTHMRFDDVRCTTENMAETWLYLEETGFATPRRRLHRTLRLCAPLPPAQGPSPPCRRPPRGPTAAPRREGHGRGARARGRRGRRWRRSSSCRGRGRSTRRSARLTKHRQEVPTDRSSRKRKRWRVWGLQLAMSQQNSGRRVRGTPLL